MGKSLHVLFFTLLIYTPFALPSDPSGNPLSIQINPSTLIKFNQQILNSPFKKISRDPSRLVNPEFQVPPFLFDATNFWFNIYTFYSDQFVVFHDKVFHNLVYDAMDFSELHKSKIGNITRANLKAQYLSDRTREIRQILRTLALRQPQTSQEHKIVSTIASRGINIPEKRAARKKFFNTLASGVRSQTGLKNIVERGLINYEPYANALKNYFIAFKIPKEILSIAFVESSFNPRAQSKAGASGAWQFVTRTAKHFMPVQKNYDCRKNVLISTLSAIHLLKENHLILKSWPLAITAYNSGTRQILNAKKQFKNHKMTLDDFFNRYEHPTIGFASKNYYSEFLAMTYALAYKNNFFPSSTNPAGLTELSFSLCITKKTFSLNSLVKGRPKSSALYLLNNHLVPSQKYSAGTIVVSDHILPKQEFRCLLSKEILAHYPKNFHKIIQSKAVQ